MGGDDCCVPPSGGRCSFRMPGPFFEAGRGAGGFEQMGPVTGSYWVCSFSSLPLPSPSPSLLRLLPPSSVEKSSSMMTGFL
eukprot:2564322-Pleurochrysis_carterae.AAC.1